MRNKYLLLTIVLMSLLSCKKYKDSGNPPPVVPPVTPPVLLKEMSVERLPSPYYHFEYDNKDKLSFASFASDFARYTVRYDGDRIKETQNMILVNKDKLEYFYDNSGNVTSVNYEDSLGNIYTKVNLTYDGKHLVALERKIKSGTDFVTNKTMSFTYLADGNLDEVATHYPAVGAQIESRTLDKYEQYDDKINVDGFDIIHEEFFDHLILLPQVSFQINNPKKVTHTGDGDNFEVDYGYTYNEKNLPLVKNGLFTILNGPNEGEKFPAKTEFTYY